MRHSLYERVGGKPFFENLTRRFYAAVADDPVLRPIYPADSEGFEAARAHLELFLVQYWGGPATYNETRGQPRLRMRHAHFAIGQAERDAWVEKMSDAVRASGLDPLDEMQVLQYFANSATHLINQPPDAPLD